MHSNGDNVTITINIVSRRPKTTGGLHPYSAYLDYEEVEVYEREPGECRNVTGEAAYLRIFADLHQFLAVCVLVVGGQVKVLQ